ncbi:MAG: hypothetical protein IPI35_18200 [Deltaproteobacteria bacterium]|nr:hypothetical protein [Deltaproteobacteria bacterium]
MRTLFVIDPIDTFNLQGDSSWMLMVETARRGWPQAWCLVTDLRVRNGKAVTQARNLEVDVNAWSYRYDAEQEEPLDAFDVVWMRKDPPFNMDYIFATYILDLALKTTLILNDPRSIKASNEKMVALQWPEFCPPTLVTNRIPEIVAFAEAHDRIVLKPWDGNGGRGVLVTDRDDRNLRSMAECSPARAARIASCSAICLRCAKATNASSSWTASPWAGFTGCPLKATTGATCTSARRCTPASSPPGILISAPPSAPASRPRASCLSAST